MTLIDKAEALAALRAAGILRDEAYDAIRTLPARGVGVKPLIFSEFKEGGCMGRPHPFQYFITQAHNGRFLCHHDETWHETLEAAQAHAQVAYQSAALAPTDAAQAREAALDAIKMGFLSAAPGEWRVSNIERVTEAILRALEQEGR